jgi:hypothetical protein
MSKGKITVHIDPALLKYLLFAPLHPISIWRELYRNGDIETQRAFRRILRSTKECESNVEQTYDVLDEFIRQ